MLLTLNSIKPSVLSISRANFHEAQMQTELNATLHGGIIPLIFSTILAAALVSGCATSARPMPIAPRVALTATVEQVMQMTPGKAIGGVTPVDVAVANGTDEPYLVVPNQGRI